VIHLRKIAIKPVLYFPPHMFSAPLLYLVRQASYLTDIHSDEHQNEMVTLGESQDKKTPTKHAKTSQDSQSKCSKCRPLAFTQPYAPLVNGLVDDWLLYTRPRCNQASLRITYRCRIHSILHDTPNLVIQGKFTGNISAKNYPNRPRINKVIVKIKRVQFFWNTV